ncbi:hypothetical protein GCM10018780_82250 [Streptomyces lanatus]|nr:hypothetical protein GCM10018780_82250 [Streptomyces lanatus]
MLHGAVEDIPGKGERAFPSTLTGALNRHTGQSGQVVQVSMRDVAQTFVELTEHLGPVVEKIGVSAAAIRLLQQGT